MKITCNIWDKLPLGATAPFSLKSGGPVIGEAEVTGDNEMSITIHKGHEDEVREAMGSHSDNISISSVCLGENKKRGK